GFPGRARLPEPRSCAKCLSEGLRGQVRGHLGIEGPPSEEHEHGFGMTLVEGAECFRTRRGQREQFAVVQLAVDGSLAWHALLLCLGAVFCDASLAHQEANLLVAVDEQPAYSRR